jgi:predicted component of type VI protein secretion system
MIHWHEGLFLQPHHLQNYSREVRESIGRERRLAFAYPYGVLDCKISSDGLENNLVRLDRLHVVMPSGLEIDVPGNASVPALDIKRIFANNPGGFTVSLAVPLYQEGRANTIESIGDADVRIKRLYRISETASPDENTGENSQPMLVRKINARLVTDADDTTDMEVIPLLRIMASAEESTIPRPDSRFIPPCMTISGSPTLKNLLRDLANAVEAARSLRASGAAHSRAGNHLEACHVYARAEVLDADGFCCFEAAGDPFDPDVAARLRRILEAGDTRDPMELYVEFRGSAPNTEALLRHRGLVALDGG